MKLGVHTFRLSKFILILALAVLVAWWSHQAWNKLINVQVATTYQSRYGDDHRGNVQPFAVSICSRELTFKGPKSGMYLNLIDFMNKEVEAFESFAKVQESLVWNVSSLVKACRFGMEKVWRNEDIRQVWMPNMDATEGMCYTFDPKKHGMALVPLKFNGNIRTTFSISLNFTEARQLYPNNFDWHSAKIYIHNVTDDLKGLKYKSGSYFSLKPGVSITLDVEKKVFKSFPTQEKPCMEAPYYSKFSCIEEKAQLELKKKYKCLFPWMVESPNVGKICEWNEEVIKDYECWMSETSSFLLRCRDGRIQPDFGCEELDSCQSMHLHFDQTEEFTNSSISKLILTWNDDYITYLEDFISYDLQSFVGEVGGIFGLFLGFSFISICDLMDYVFSKIFSFEA